MKGLKHLFTPWRMQFIKEEKKQAGCILCNIPKQEDSVENLVLYRTDHCYVVMNKYPYNTGHMMVVPFDHQADLSLLPSKVMHDVHDQVQFVVSTLKKTHSPNGFNLGLNIGQAGGAGIPDHLHFHIVPRWIGDTNFMPLLSGTRVLPETVQETYARVLKAIQAAR